VGLVIPTVVVVVVDPVNRCTPPVVGVIDEEDWGHPNLEDRLKGLVYTPSWE